MGQNRLFPAFVGFSPTGDSTTSQNSLKTTILSVILPDFDPMLWQFNINLGPKRHSRPLKNFLKSLSPARQNINPVRKHCCNWSPVQHLSPNGSPWILVDRKCQLFFYQTTVKIISTSCIKIVVSQRNHAKYNWHLETLQIHVKLFVK